MTSSSSTPRYLELQNGCLRLAFDARTGNLVRIEDTQRRLTHFDARAAGSDDASLFRVMTPGPRWSSRHADSGDPPPRITQTADGLVLQYDDLRAGGEPTGLVARVTVSQAGEADEFRFQMELTNQGRHDVTDINFPLLSGWSGVAGKGRDELMLGGVTRVDPHHFPSNVGTTYVRYHRRETYGYPIQMYAPWWNLAGSPTTGGVASAIYTQEGRIVDVMLDNQASFKPGIRLRIGWTHFTLVKPGQTWRSPSISLRAHGGDWRDTADRFNAWVSTWAPPAETPAWTRRSIGYQNVMFQGFDGTPLRPLEELAEVAATGRRYGVDHLSVWDYSLLGNYAKLADGDIMDFGPGRRDELERQIRQARAAGTRVSALVNFRLVNPTSTLYRQGAHNEVNLRYNGTPPEENYPVSHWHSRVMVSHLGPSSYPLDARVASYRARVLAQIKEYLALGFDSVFYDQPFETKPSYRSDVAGGPDAAHPAIVSLVREVRELVKRNNPEGIIIGEFGDYLAAPWIDLWMSWYRSFDALEGASYTVPQTLHSWVVDSDPAAASRAFATGAQLFLMTHGGEGTLADEPAFAAHVAQLAQLKATCIDHIAGSQFRHTRGLEIDGDGAVAFAFDSAHGPFVMLAAPGQATRVRIRADLAGAGQSGGPSRLHRLDGRVETVAPDTLDVTLAANEVAVWVP